MCARRVAAIAGIHFGFILHLQEAWPGKAQTASKSTQLAILRKFGKKLSNAKRSLKAETFTVRKLTKQEQSGDFL